MEGSKMNSLFETIYQSLCDQYLTEDTGLDDKDLRAIADRVVIDIQRNHNTKVEKFLFVEDGSVDLDELGAISITNPEIKVIVVRQGGRVPELREVR